ncbi:MAG: hypothetical protein GFH27_549291n291 [Chloroflexi bacterium AL-W]|nr:hypothetical protein [Chloroflexi bacterium AL-N1]NOK67241.1 hypothetical protein [Chloroflexi bacterium AL-N10]NOK75265.1 hypothetical protein [Chloroflexi bacterium AL-N5]NOK82053.1 hypothetical protein [Chloroflexi bacterium AL-W]NOK89898.1 hypothetical protein [Chloroflexi bacterium AL-N15]
MQQRHGDACEEIGRQRQCTQVLPLGNFGVGCYHLDRASIDFEELEGGALAGIVCGKQLVAPLGGQVVGILDDGFTEAQGLADLGAVGLDVAALPIILEIATGR